MQGDDGNNSHITGGGELRLNGSSLKQSTSCFRVTLVAVIACQRSVSAWCASYDNVTNFTKKGTKGRRGVLCANETDHRKQLCQFRGKQNARRQKRTLN